MNKDATVATMTRFEYIAVKVLQAMISNGQHGEDDVDDVVETAISIAEDMESKLDDYIFWGPR